MSAVILAPLDSVILAASTSRGIILLGETAILCDEHGNLTSFTVMSGGSIQSKCGAFRHDLMLGKPYGTLFSPTGEGAEDGRPAHVLKLTPELWTLSLPRRTQILFSADISLVVLRLNARPGAILIESGTGSGSLTHALARAVVPGGTVHTFEFNKHRADAARDEFTHHGLGGVVRSVFRDVVADGFVGVGGAPPHTATGLFLDVPNPWAAIKHAATALALGGVLCSFSPCVEQVARVVAAATALGFGDVCVIETLARPWVASKAPRFVPDIDIGIDAPEGGGGAAATIVEVHIDESSFTALPAAPLSKFSSHYGEKRAREEKGADQGASTGGLTTTAATAAVAIRATTVVATRTRPFPPLPPVDYITAQPVAHARGHTGYLLFCTKFQNVG